MKIKFIRFWGLKSRVVESSSRVDFRVMDHQLASNPITRARRESRNDCMELCLTDDNCRQVSLL